MLKLKTLYNWGHILKTENFRKEYKLILTSSEIENFLRIFNIKSKTLYESRVVKSLYMDTKKFDIFNNSQEFDVGRYTLRYRNYSNDSNINLEVKENTIFGKYKSSKKTNYKSFDKIKYLNFRGYLTIPTLFVTYKRNYYNFGSARFTVDQNLFFENTSNRSLSHRKHCSNFNILEIKLMNISDYDVENFLIKNPQTFSKFKYGVSKIYDLDLL